MKSPLRYVGSGPYCFANSLAMVLGPDAPDPSLIEVLTGSPFGVSLLGGNVPFFSPPGWDPEVGLEAAIELLGWKCGVASGGTDDEAMDLLRELSAKGPVLVGPLEMGLLLHHPGSGRPIGSDHFVVVIAVEDGKVCFHDPHGHPFATLAIDEFADAWRADSIGYANDSFTLRTEFRRVRDVDPLDAMRASVPLAIGWLEGSGNATSAKAVERLADLVHGGLETWQLEHLLHFAIRTGARRLADASTWFTEIGYDQASEVAAIQARLVGSLQYDLNTGQTYTAVTTLRRLAPTYEYLRSALVTATGQGAPEGDAGDGAGGAEGGGDAGGGGAGGGALEGFEIGNTSEAAFLSELI